MKLLDSNVWVSLALKHHQLHLTASEWLRGQSELELAFCRATQLSFLGLMTARAVFAEYGIPPLTNEGALDLLVKFLASPQVAIVDEPEDLDNWFRKFASRDSASPKVWMDAYLAAFAVAGKHQIVTTDKGFRQFEGLDVMVLA